MNEHKFPATLEEFDKMLEEDCPHCQFAKKKERERIIKEEIKFLQILCMSGGISKVAMDTVFKKIEELKSTLTIHAGVVTGGKTKIAGDSDSGR